MSRSRGTALVELFRVGTEPPPTTGQFNCYQRMFDHFNRELFGLRLPHVMLNFSRDVKQAVGYYAARRWAGHGQQLDEITLNPDYLTRGPRDTAATLVHEMVHLWQQSYGKPSRAGYHNKEWADKMTEVGLIPSSTGRPGGRRVGQRMTHYVAKEGAFLRSFTALSLSLPWQSEGRSHIGAAKYQKAKVKYSCRQCGTNVWGKPGLQLGCMTCEVAFSAE